MKKIEQTYGYDDVAIVPGEITLNPELVDTNTKIGELELDVPIFASAMDSVVDPKFAKELSDLGGACLLYTSPSPRDKRQSRMPSSA